MQGGEKRKRNTHCFLMFSAQVDGSRHVAKELQLEHFSLRFLYCFGGFSDFVVLLMSYFFEGFCNQVLHLRDQIEIGLGVCERFMEKRCLLVRASGDKSGLTAMVRRVLADANQKFQGVEAEKMHHIGFLDLSKYGRLTVPDINEAATWCYQVLSLNDNYSILVIPKSLVKKFCKKFGNETCHEVCAWSFAQCLLEKPSWGGYVVKTDVLRTSSTK